MKIINGTYIDPINDIMIKKDLVSGSSDDGIVIDATGLLIGPGLVDTHVHFRDPGFIYKEDILTGACAAAAGGYTDVVLMANTNPKVDNSDTLAYVIEKGKQTDINVYTCANVTVNMEGKELTDMPRLLSEGAVGFTDDGIPLMNEDIAYQAIKTAAIMGAPISFHEENPNLIGNNGINRGMASEHYGISGSPREAEIDLIARDIEIVRRVAKELSESEAEHKPIDMVIQHISTKEGVDLVRGAKRDGLNIHAEATPHHFSLTEEAAITYGSMAKMNPPLRTEEDRLAIIEGLKDGTIDLIATDHAPHSSEEKARKITEAPSGIIGLETALSLAIKNLVQPGFLTYPQLFKCMSLAPSLLYKIKKKEDFSLNQDLVIFDPNEMRKYESFASKSENSPFKGHTLPGVIRYTVCNGRVVYSD